MGDDLRSKVARGAIWTTIEQVSVQGLNFGLGIVLARLLSPEDYGSIALVTIFISVAQVIVNSGFGQALVQKKESDELDVNSVFYTSLGISLVAYAVLFFAAPYVAAYYETPELRLVLRVLAINLILYSINAVQSAELYKQMRFNISCRVALITTVVSAAVGISLAFGGWGVWALVGSSILGNVAGVLARAFYISWHPRLMFSVERLKPLFRFGGKMLATSLVNTTFNNLYGILIGKFYTKADLAFVNKGQNLPQMLTSNINAAVIEVAFPALVQLQDDRPRLCHAMRRLLRISFFIVCPCMALMAGLAEQMILFLYGEKWLSCVPYVQIVCASAMVGPLNAVAGMSIVAIGRSDVTLRLAIIGNLLSLSILASCLMQGVLFWMVVSTLVGGAIGTGLNMYCNSHFLSYSLRDQMLDALPSLALCGFLGGSLWLSGRVFPSATSPGILFVELTVKGLLAAFAYLGVMIAFRFRVLQEVVALVAPKVIRLWPGFARFQTYLGDPDAS